MKAEFICRRIAVAIACALPAMWCPAQTRDNAPEVHIVYMGGNDCPPCVAWRATELPRLQQTDEFKSVRFSYVTKAVKSPVPVSIFLPDEVKPFKGKLDEAGAGRGGSPQTAILVNGEIFDYYRGWRSADEVVSMLVAIRTGGKYPFKRCLKQLQSGGCEIRGGRVAK